MSTAHLILAAAALIAFAASVSIHRYFGLCAAVAGGFAVAYFYMPPLHSFRVSEASDIAALSVYGVFGLLLTYAGQNKRSHNPQMDECPAPCPGLRKDVCSHAALETALDMHRARLQHPGIRIEAAAMPQVPVLTHDELVQIFCDLIAATLAIEGAQHVSVNTALTPETVRLYWVVRARSTPPLPYVVKIGQADVASERARFPQWPPSVGVTVFDNGFQVVHQISFRRVPG